MTKYVIDLPAAATVIVAKNPFLPNETDLMRIPVSQLELYVEPTVAENAPVEKRVIELPVELFNYLLKIKKTHRGGISHFMGDAIKKRLIIQDLDTEDVLKDEMLVDWYLHPELVEFVPKKGHKFVVRSDKTDRDGTYVYSRVYNGIASTSIFLNLATKFDTYEEAKEWANSHQVVVEIDAEGNEVEE